MNKNVTSQQLSESLAQNNARVRYEYERYPEFPIGDENQAIVKGKWGFLASSEDIKVVGRSPVKLSVLKQLGTSIYEKGGRVTAFIVGQDNEPVAQGVAECSIADLFDKELGRRIALGRAIRAQALGQDVLGPKYPNEKDKVVVTKLIAKA